MDEHNLGIVQPPHLLPFDPLTAQEVSGLLRRMLFQIACFVADELRSVLRGSRLSWWWFFTRLRPLQQYLESIYEVVCAYPASPRGRLPLRTHADVADVRSVESTLRDWWVRLDATAEAIVREFMGLHLPCWVIVLGPARIA